MGQPGYSQQWPQDLTFQDGRPDFGLGIMVEDVGIFEGRKDEESRSLEFGVDPDTKMVLDGQVGVGDDGREEPTIVVDCDDFIGVIHGFPLLFTQADTTDRLAGFVPN